MSDKKRERFTDTLDEIADQVRINSRLIDIDQVLCLIDIILYVNSTGSRVFVYGSGRSGFIGRCFAQRLMHLGVNSCFISDAITYQYTEKDVVVIISGSGETTSPVAIAQKAKKIGGKIVLLTNNPKSTIALLADCVVKIVGKSKDVAISQDTLAPYTSLFDISTLSVLDSIGGTLMKILGVSESDIDNRHATLE